MKRNDMGYPVNEDHDKDNLGVASGIIYALGITLVGALLFIAGCFLLTPKAHAADIVKVAQSQIGRGEQGGDNKGRDVKKYTMGKEVAWCSGFVSWVVNRAGKTHNYFLSARSWLKSKDVKRVALPKPGDLIVFDRGNGKGHVGIVEKRTGNRITTIEGNVGPYPAKVKRLSYTLGHIPNLIAFVRIK